MAPVNQPAYNKDERALCFHGELLYEAKVLDIKPIDASDKKSGFYYLVHYKGWKSTWDDWVPQDRLRKLTEENKELARNLREEAQSYQRNKDKIKIVPGGKKRGADSVRDSEERHSSVAAANQPRAKRARDVDVEKVDDFIRRPQIHLHVPDNLKSLLVDDWEEVTKNLKLVPLPSNTPVSQVLDEYELAEKKNRVEGSADWDLLEEVVVGLKEYFNKSLGRVLLYRFERDQYVDIHNRSHAGTGDLAGKEMSEVYGGEHLLRLFTSLPELIAQTNMDQQAVTRLKEELSKLMLWLAKDAQIRKYFCVAYESPSEDYTRKMQSSTGLVE